MNILLWIFQCLVAFQSISGALWRFAQWDQAAKNIPSLAQAPAGVWGTLGVIELACALGLILPGAFKFMPILTAYAAAILAVDLLAQTWLHIHYGFTPAAYYTGYAAVLSLFIAYGRFALRPL